MYRNTLFILSCIIFSCISCSQQNSRTIYSVCVDKSSKVTLLDTCYMAGEQMNKRIGRESILPDLIDYYWCNQTKYTPQNPSRLHLGEVAECLDIYIPKEGKPKPKENNNNDPIMFPNGQGGFWVF